MNDTMKTCLAAVVLYALILSVGCAPVTVSYDYDKSVDFATLKTYDWLDIPLEEQADELTVKRIKNSIDSQLNAKGFARTTASPGFVILLHGFTEIVTNVVDWGPTYGGYYSYWHNNRVNVYEYEEGTVILDIIDPTTKDLIWRGRSTGMVESQLTPEERDKKINESVALLMQNFPPTTIKK
jgi:hypothetical protein